MSWLSRTRRALDGLILRRRITAWGDGFVDEGFDGLAGSPGWVDVAVDELVILFPSLTADRSSTLARRRLAAQVAAARARLRSVTSDEPPELARHGEAWLTHLSQALDEGRDPSPASLLDAVVVSFSTRLNAAYLLPAYEPLHDTLAAAAWLGIAASGRPALLPAVFGPTLGDLVRADAPSGGGPDWSFAHAYLVHRLRSAGLAEPLEKALSRIAKGAGAATVAAPATAPVRLRLERDLADALVRSTEQLTPSGENRARA